MPTFTEDDHPVPYAPHVGGVTQLQQTVASLIGRLRSAEDELTQQADQIDRLVIDNRQTIELVQRVEALEAKAHRRKTPGPRALDATNQAIVDYLTVEVPGVWLTPMAIAANMGDAVSHRAVAANMGDAVSHRAVAARLVRLSRDGHVERRGGYTSGANPLYRVTPKQQPETGAQS